MQSLNTLQRYFERELKKVVLKDQPKRLYSPVDYVIKIGGKRIRPVLLLASYLLFKNKIGSVINAAIAIELFHNFTLLHDDIMDNAPIRRGKQTVHEKWNKNTAILSGDAMLILTYQYLVKIKSKNFNLILNEFNTTALKVCEGQQKDMDFENDHNVSILQYIEMIKNKTAVLLAGSLKIGALLANQSDEVSKKLYNFGLKIGIAFQLQDDLLDTYGDSSSFGKKIGGDILSNKKTFLYLKSLELASNKVRYELMDLYKDKNFEEKNKISKVKDIFNSLKVRKMLELEIDSFHKEALSYLNSIKHCDKKVLIEFSDQLINRQK